MARTSERLRHTKRSLSAMMRRLRRPHKVPLILMYHRIAKAATDPWRLAVAPVHFDAQLAFLKRNRLVMPLTEFGHLHRAGRLPANAVTITFDDGYACNALTAAPLLENHGLPATVFLTTGSISSGEEFWWDALERIILESDMERLDLCLGGKATSIVLGRRDEANAAYSWNAMVEPATTRESAYFQLWSKLRVARHHERREAMAALHRQASVSGAARPSHRAITAAEVVKMTASGLIEIGAHSVTHPALSQLMPADQRAEIERSRDACSMLIGRVPRAFAYPYGDYDNSAVEIVGDAGFDVACTTQACGVGVRSQILGLPRLAVGNWNALGLKAAMRSVDPE
jgi:peptidoglycan/xylan/chitin deacetylase (PgdA/CDA1 family)